jgi:hypothetical protein
VKGSGEAHHLRRKGGADLDPEQTRRDVIDLGVVRARLNRGDGGEESGEVLARDWISEQRDIAVRQRDIGVGKRSDQTQRVGRAVHLPEFESSETGLRGYEQLLDEIVAVEVARKLVVIEQEVAAQPKHHAVVEDALDADIAARDRAGAVDVVVRERRAAGLVRGEKRAAGVEAQPDLIIADVPLQRFDRQLRSDIARFRSGARPTRRQYQRRCRGRKNQDASSTAAFHAPVSLNRARITQQEWLERNAQNVPCDLRARRAAGINPSERVLG